MRQGVTLVEVLVSVTILALGLVSGVNCLATALSCNQRADHLAIATALAQSEVETQRSSGNLSSSTTVIGNPLLPNGQLTDTVTDYNTALNCKRLQVTVKWRGRRGQWENIGLDTIVFLRAKHVGG